MSLLLAHDQSTIVPLTEELNSELFWLGGTIGAGLRDETFRSFGGAATIFDGPSAFSAGRIPSFEDDYLSLPPPRSGDMESVRCPDSTLDMCNVLPSVVPEDLYQDTYRELFGVDYNTWVPADTTAMYQESPPASTTPFAYIPFTTAPVDPSTTAVYAPYIDYTSHFPSSDGAIIASLPPASPPVSSHSSDNPGSDDDRDHVIPSDRDEEYHPTRSGSYQKQKKGKAASKSKSLRPTAYSPGRSTSSRFGKSSCSSRNARRSHLYTHGISPRNFQCDGAAFLGWEFDFQCPFVGCDYIQKKRCTQDFKRHIATHNRWREPDKWTCCGVEVGNGHLYRKDIRQDMTEEEWTEAGAYMFRGRLMIGGCMKTFSRRDSLKRHVDNPNIPCLGVWTSYYC